MFWLAVSHSVILKIIFMAEIGDATVGSLAVTASKDSGLVDQNLAGSFYKIVVGLTYINHEGWVRTITRTQPHSKQYSLSCTALLVFN